MIAKSTSPFAGLKLTDQTPFAPRGTDQQLFVPAPKTTPPKTQHSSDLPRKEGSQEPRKVGSQVAGKPDAVTAAPLGTANEHAPFDITVPATEKNSYMFSQEELWALRDVESELERTYRTEVSKYNIVRLGLHYLLEDYYKDRKAGFLVRRLGLKSK